MSRLYNYLTSINKGELINYEIFKKSLPVDIKIDHHLIFKAQKQAKGKYSVEVLDDGLFQKLIAENIPPENREDAAVQGDSHLITTSHSFLLVYRNQLLDTRPDVVLIDNNIMHQTFTPKKQLLIIENQENFFRYCDMLPILSDFYGSPLDLSNTDIVFGAGNQINKGLNFCFFEQYHSVLCAFDFDFGGLTMFNTLKTRLACQVTLLMPDDLTKYYPGFVKQPKEDTWMKALNLSQTLGFTSLHDAFIANGAVMEQEVLLALDNKKY
jgi:hypothetical protein